MTKYIVHPQHSTDGSKVVWKYQVDLEAGPMAIGLPDGARLVHSEFVKSDFMKREFFLWYEVDLERSMETHNVVFEVFGTGDNGIPRMGKHVATGVEWNYDHRSYPTVPQWVWHLYEYPSGTEVRDG